MTLAEKTEKRLADYAATAFALYSNVFLTFDEHVVSHAPRLSVVLPTYNESASLPHTVERISNVLRDIAHEIIVVDDASPDGTTAVARGLSEERDNVRCVRRVGRRGLSGACVEGMMAASAPVVAIVDADGQHDETILPKMLAAIDNGDRLVVGTRYAEKQVADGFSAERARASHFATDLALYFLPRKISDPMSGFFMLTRDLADEVAPKLSREGFKILFDILSNIDPKERVGEVPYTFRERAQGESKLSKLVAIQFVGLLVSRLTRGLLPPQFVLFSLVGASGVLVHLLVLSALIGNATPFIEAQAIATLVAMTTNFTLNNSLTYAHRRLRGWGFVRGLILFCAFCSVGSLANIGVAAWIYGFRASPLAAGLAGALMGLIFNYAVTKAAIWRDA